MKKGVLSVITAVVMLCSCGADSGKTADKVSRRTANAAPQLIEGTIIDNADTSSVSEKKTTTATSAVESTVPEAQDEDFPELSFMANFYLADRDEGYLEAFKAIQRGLFNHDDEIKLPKGVVSKKERSDFFVFCTKSYYWTDNTGDSFSSYSEDDYVTSLLVEYSNSAQDELEMYNKVRERAQEIAEQACSNSDSDFEKLCYIHDTIVADCEYSYEGENVHGAYGALVDRKAVCEGYAKAFALICDMADIPCLYVSGNADNGEGSEGHAWNKVKLDGKWYNVDCTWDDPLGNDGSKIEHEYLLLSDEQISVTHSPESNTFMPAPQATDSKGDWFYRMGKVITADDDIYEILDTFISQIEPETSDTIEFKCESDEVYNKVCNEWFDNDNGEHGVFTVMRKYAVSSGSLRYSKIVEPEHRYISLTINS